MRNFPFLSRAGEPSAFSFTPESTLSDKANGEEGGGEQGRRGGGEEGSRGGGEKRRGGGQEGEREEKKRGDEKLRGRWGGEEGEKRENRERKGERNFLKNLVDKKPQCQLFKGGQTS